MSLDPLTISVFLVAVGLLGCRRGVEALQVGLRARLPLVVLSWADDADALFAAGRRTGVYHAGLPTVMAA